ncbi:AMP-binding protein [Blastomonas sp. AAP53]|uniref:AMP-binding protein n=1 Tax=Blastomonas sp. AAP53 TaxID=1248760 RepID=UPI00047616FD|nr:AMP-binding protein [Blastomonas sp. AAP53]
MTTIAQAGQACPAALKPVNFMPRDIDCVQEADGTIFLRSRTPLRPCRNHLLDYLHHHADHRPDATWLAERRAYGEGWSSITFADARQQVDALTEGLLVRLGDHPANDARLALLGDNSIDYALIMLAAMQARITVVPLSAAYAMPGNDHARLRGLIETAQPTFIFADSVDRFGDALRSLADFGMQVFTRTGGEAWPQAETLAMLRGNPGERVSASRHAIDPLAPARLMFTSGSTGLPKAVIHTQRAMVDAAESLLQVTGVDETKPMVRLDWAPWSHVFGVTNLMLTLIVGGTFYIDDGRPSPDGMARTIRNLREVLPTGYANVPAGFAALVSAMEADATLAARFFNTVDYISYASARLPDDVSERLQALSVAHCGYRLPITSGFGSTETAAAGSFVHWPTASSGLIGLPQPGVELKLVPVGDGRYEVRQRGIGIFPGYHANPVATAAAFDDDGWYRSGDAASFVDPDDIQQGLAFAGRLTEEFKLQTGIFVKVGPLRAEIMAQAGPLIQDIVLCGEGEAYVTALVWLNPMWCGRLAALDPADRAAINANLQVRADLSGALARFNASHTASSERLCRVMLLDEPPCLESGEITDKGTINQALVRRRRADSVAALYAAQPASTLLVLDR